MRISADQLRSVAQPTLFVWGGDDPFGSPDAGRVAMELMPNARLEIVGRGHLPWWDEPEACAHLVREFVQTSKKPRL
jgi:2-hydroxy-6-oxonona-2,4-dienedioate hydrolase